MTVRMIGRVAYLVAEDVPQCTYTLTPDVYRGLSQNVCRPNRYSEPTNIESMSEGNRGATPETIVHRFREGMRFSLRNTLQQIGTRYTYVRGTSKGPTKSKVLGTYALTRSHPLSLEDHQCGDCGSCAAVIAVERGTICIANRLRKCSGRMEFEAFEYGQYVICSPARTPHPSSPSTVACVVTE